MVMLLKAQPGCASWLRIDLVPAFPFGGSFKTALGLFGKTTALMSGGFIPFTIQFI